MPFAIQGSITIVHWTAPRCQTHNSQTHPFSPKPADRLGWSCRWASEGVHGVVARMNSPWGALLRLATAPLHHEKGHPQAKKGHPGNSKISCNPSFPTTSSSATPVFHMNSHPILLLPSVDHIIPCNPFPTAFCCPHRSHHFHKTTMLKRRTPGPAFHPWSKTISRRASPFPGGCPTTLSGCPPFPIIGVKSHPWKKTVE